VIETLLVIGDSLSTEATAWHSYLPATYHVHIMAQAGRRISEYQPPRDIRGNHKLVYFIGTGDILYLSPAEKTKVYITEHLEYLAGRGYEITVVTPPLFNLKKFDQLNREHRKVINAIPNVNHCDLAWVWDKTMTWDGIHPTPELSMRIAYTIQGCLER
jgi:hypothetical protein